MDYEQDDGAPGSTDELSRLKKYVERWHEYFKFNNKRWWDCTKFACATTISSAQRTALAAIGKPELQCNIIEAKVSRLRGEFAKHAPSFEVRAADGVPIEALTPQFNRTTEIIEGHMRAMFSDSTNDGLRYKFYSDELLGGFTAGKVTTDYVNSNSFEQVIKVERVFDPTMVFFDPLARMSHKGDGMYCGELIPMSVEDFETHYGKNSAEGIKFNSADRIEGFRWGYQNQNQNIILVARIFLKVRKRIQIVKLSNGHTVPKSHYKKLLKLWADTKIIPVPPKVLDTRWTTKETIVCKEFCDTKVMKSIPTDFEMLPIVFGDGNSVLIRGADAGNGGIDTMVDTGGDTNDGATQQFTKPYILHAMDVQLLLNFSMQSLAAEMENVVQHQYIAAKESIPKGDYESAYTNPQLASVLVYQQWDDKDPTKQNNPPQILERRQIPPIYENTFNSAINNMELTLGSYDSSLGINDNQLSGVAIQQGALQSNAAALPYLVGFNNMQSRLAEIVLNMIPKYYRTPRTLPIIKPDGKRAYQVINQPQAPDNIMMDYDPNNLQIKVEMGVSAAVQKQVAIDQIIRLTAASPDFAEFINQFGLEVILDNMDIRGIDHLKELSVQYMKAKQQAQQEAQGKPSEIEIAANAEKEIAMMQTEQQREKAQGEAANKATQLSIEKQKVDLQFIELMSKIQNDEKKVAIEQEKVSSENARTAVEMSLNIVDNLTKE